MGQEASGWQKGGAGGGGRCRYACPNVRCTFERSDLDEGGDVL